VKKTKVLQIPLRNNRGGIAKYILENWRFINKEEFLFDFITFQSEIDIKDELISEGCKIHYISCYPSKDRSQFHNEVNRILDDGYDAIHLHTSRWTGTELEEIAMARGIPNIIVHSHNTNIAIPDEQTERHKLFIQRHEVIKHEFSNDWKRYATNLCACSDMAGRWLFGDRLTDNEVYIMKNAVDVERFSYNKAVREKYRRAMNLENCFIIGHVGRFGPQKNHEFLIDVFREVARIIPVAHLLLVGGGPKFDEIKDMAHKYGLTDRTEFLGLRDDVLELMQAMDVFVLPSLFEGLPTVLVEAQATGLMCFASDEISREAKVLQETRFLPLDKDVWHEALAETYQRGYERKNTTSIVYAAGYSIKESVKNVEKLYRGELRK
jgi:glycosyltransferase involved in cell wall biosynthesis